MRVLGIVLCLALGLAGLHFWLIDGLDGWLWSLTLKEDTVYTAGYTDSGFRQVRGGMSEEEVHRLLGPPQARWSIPVDRSGIDAGERWSFSPGDTNYRCRVVLFRKGHVAEKHAEFYVD
ncbi:MAG TPA: hypothetical protein VLX28_08665 [Thermoanaerobaculia bacterium]|nr:hypothetical protein [Thermoanaerobaculia bacterium]